MGLRKNNERVEGVIYNIHLAESPANPAALVKVTVIYSGPAAVRYAADGTVVSREPAAQNAQEELVLRRAGSSWLVREVNRL